jgi:CubicO group peptidase (beta-lactamase class C family)
MSSLRLIAIVIAICTTATSQSVPQNALRDLDRYVLAHAANGDFNGTVLVTSHGKTLYSKNNGAASLRFGVPVVTDTRFGVASVTKTLTAAAVALLVSDGKLRIEDSVDKYLPDFPRGNEIKVWHLLLHQSGLRNPDEADTAGRNLSADELLGFIVAKPLAFAPGSTNSYSNAGYAVLARVVERVSGLPFEDFLSRRIFKPCGMTASGHWRSGSIVKNLADGYTPGIGTALRTAIVPDPSSLFGSGSVYSTAADLDRWLTAIDQKKLFDISKQPYPFGWGRRKWFNRDILVQSGEIPGYSAIILTVPAEQLHIVVAMNTGSGFTADEGKTLLGILYGQPFTLPEKRMSPPAVGRATLAGYAGTYSWGPNKTAMHIEVGDEGLTLRWGNSRTSVLLTPVPGSEFLDRTNFDKIGFKLGAATFTSPGSPPMECPRAQ